jgi:hypothetical protein
VAKDKSDTVIDPLAVVEFGQQPAIIVTVFSTHQPPS